MTRREFRGAGGRARARVRGKLTFEALSSMMAGPDTEERTYEVGTNLVIRQTTSVNVNASGAGCENLPTCGGSQGQRTVETNAQERRVGLPLRRRNAREFS